MLNESQEIPGLFENLRPIIQRGGEAILVDGGSSDDSVVRAEAFGLRICHSARGRAVQMNVGAAQATGDLLLFLHADTRLPQDADALVVDVLHDGRFAWGRFDIRIAASTLTLRSVGWLMNQRSRWTGIATGDQAMFVSRSAFDQVGGFPNQPLMEDVELSRRLRRISPPACIGSPVITSARRWESHGVWRTIFLMWRLRFAYWRGVPARVLAESYR